MVAHIMKVQSTNKTSGTITVAKNGMLKKDPTNSALMRIRSFHNSTASPLNNYYATVLYGSQWGGTPIINKQWNNDDFQKWDL